MIRLFQVYYPVRTLVLLAGEAVIFCASFILATMIRFGPDSELVLTYENGLYKILAIALAAVLVSYYFDLYAPQRLTSKAETYFRLLVVLGLLSFLLGGVGYFFPRFFFGKGVIVIGFVILTFAELSWRTLYDWFLHQPYLRERVYVLGSGERAARLVESIRSRSDLGIDIVGWTGSNNSALTRDDLAWALVALREKYGVNRVIVALADRRGTMPVRELLDLRLTGVKVEDASALLEKISGKIEVDDLHPSSLIYSEGFRVKEGFLFARRMVSTLVALSLLLCTLPLLPLIMLLIRLTSPGPILYRQRRVGHNGTIFTLYKFRTMRQDAEAESGATWASENDPRVTLVGRFLRSTRLDEIPQLWNVLKGEMSFVGPRPERPEFVGWLSNAIPYYHLRHIVAPGVTGWAQVKYQYGSSVEDSKQKLQFDLYYIKHVSLMLDLMILFETIKTVLLRRGAK